MIRTKISSETTMEIEKQVKEVTDSQLADISLAASYAQFERNEVIVGRLLGKGSFCHAYEVTGFQLIEDANDKISETCNRLRRKCKDGLTKNGQETMSLAIKTLDPSLLKRSPSQFCQAVTDLAFEAALLSKLDHPGIVKFYGMSTGGVSALTTDQTFFVLTEQLNETLHDRILKWRKMGKPRENMIPMKTLYAYQIASAIKYLHDRRIVYSDLKPQNVGFKGEECKLIDFGFSMKLPILTDDKNKDDAVFDLETSCTPRYASPEMLAEAGYNLKTDVYSWALVFYEILTQETVYPKYSFGQMCLQVCVEGKRPSLSRHKLPKRIERLIRKSWEHEVSSRHSMDTVCKLLFQLLERTQNNMETGEFSMTGYDS